MQVRRDPFFNKTGVSHHCPQGGAQFVGGNITDADGKARMDRFADAIKKVGPEFCILSSDLGQKGNPLPADGFGAFLEAMRAHGITDAQIDRMARRNPATLLGLSQS